MLSGTVSNYKVSDALISADGKYRYWLARIFDRHLPELGIVMLNPSTANADVDDPTILRCVATAKKWGYGGIDVCNLFAIRSSDPWKMRALPLSVSVGGRENFKHLQELPLRAEQVLLAWGNHGSHGDAGPAYVRRLLGLRTDDQINQFFEGTRAPSTLWLDKLVCLGMTNAGEPRHPLMASIPDEPVAFDAVKYLKDWIAFKVAHDGDWKPPQIQDVQL